MAHTAHKTEEELEEHYDTPEALERKIDDLAEWVRESKCFSAFTGAGISTSAGISDFRGPNGVWTLRAKGLKPKGRHMDILGVQPTPAHLALIGLLKNGHLKHLISTNTDGLHLRSGFPASHLVELHGNTNSEGCPTQPVGSGEAPYAGNGCGALVFRDERCRLEGLKVHQHATGRHCACGEPLQDTIINFGENLWPENVRAAREVAAQTDLMLTVGSSLRVSAWAPRAVAKNPGAKLVVCNLQWTPLDAVADLKIHAKADVVFAMLAARLNCALPGHRLSRRLRVTVSKGESLHLAARDMKACLRERGLESVIRGATKEELAHAIHERGIECTEVHARAMGGDGAPFAWMSSVCLSQAAGDADSHQRREGGRTNCSSSLRRCVLGSDIGVGVEIGVIGRYGEPAVLIPAELMPPRGETKQFRVEYSLRDDGNPPQQWAVSEEEEPLPSATRKAADDREAVTLPTVATTAAAPTAACARISSCAVM